MNEKEELRRKIIDTAKEIIVSEGFEVLSMRKIAAKIDYSAGIIYHYFKDKKEIADIISKEYTEEINEKIGELSEESPEKEFFTILKKYIGIIISEPLKYGAIFDMKAFAVINGENVILDRIKKVMEECSEKSIFRKLEPTLAARTVIMSLNGVAWQIINEKIDDENTKKIIDHYLYILFKGLLK